MSASVEFTSLEALPPSPGDAALAAVLLRDVAASVGSSHGGVRPAAVEVGDSGRFTLRPVRDTGSLVDADHAPLAAPELFDGGPATAATDVYAAACLALTRYLGSAPVSAPSVSHRATTVVRLGALRQAHRTMPARLGAMPAPFRGVFAQAVTKAPHLRPTPARLVALLDAALAAAGPEVEQAARARVHRLVVLARVFEPGDGVTVLKAPPTVIAFSPAPLPEHLPLRALPVFSLRTRAARGALIAAVTVVATGGVAVAGGVGLGGGANPRPQAITTLVAPSTASGPTVGPSDASSAAPHTPAPRASTGSAAGEPGSGSGAGTTVGGGGYEGGSNNGNGSGYDGPNCLSVQGFVAVALDDDPTDGGTPTGTPTSSDSSTPTSSPSGTPTQSTSPPSSPTPSISPPPSPSNSPSSPSSRPSTHSSPPPAPPGGTSGGSGSGGGGGSSGGGGNVGSGSSGC